MTTHKMGGIIYDVARDIGITTIIEDDLDELVRKAMNNYTDYNSIVRGDVVKSAAVAIKQQRDVLKLLAWKLAETDRASIPEDNVDKKLMQYFDINEKKVITETSGRFLREEQSDWRSNGSIKDTRDMNENGKSCLARYKIAGKPPLFS